MKNLAACLRFLKKVQRKHPDFFDNYKNIFSYVDAIETDKIKIYIIDESLPEDIVEEIAAIYKVINF